MVKTVIIEEHGDAGKLMLVDREVGEPGAGEIRRSSLGLHGMWAGPAPG